MRDYQQETTRSQDELKHTRACLSTFESRVEMITMQKDNAEGQFAKLTQEMEVLRQEHAATSSSGSVEQQQQHQEMQHSVQMAHKEIENLALQIEGVEDELSAARVTNKQVNDYIYIIVIYILYPPPLFFILFYCKAAGSSIWCSCFAHRVLYLLSSLLVVVVCAPFLLALIIQFCFLCSFARQLKTQLRSSRTSRWMP